MIRTEFAQYHYVIAELVLPYCTVCTPIEGVDGTWNTPLLCEESSDSTYSIFFASDGAPSNLTPPVQSIAGKSRLNATVNRVITSLTESTPQLKLGEGLSSRGSISLSMADFDGDPGPLTFTENGTYFGKLRARNVLQNKKLKIRKYTKLSGQDAILVDESLYLVENVSLSNSKMSITAVDPLKDLEEYSENFPQKTDSILTQYVDETSTSFSVSDASKFSIDDIIVIDREPMKISSINGNIVTVIDRDGKIYGRSGGLITQSEPEGHDSGATTQKAYDMDNTPVSDVLNDIFIDAGLSEYIDLAQWSDEIQQWNSDALMTGVMLPDKLGDVIDRVLKYFMIDMYFNQSTQKVTVSTSSEWRESERAVFEGDDFQDFKVEDIEDKRFTRAYVSINKRFQAETDDEENYSTVISAIDSTLEGDDFYSIKVNDFEPYGLIKEQQAVRLTQSFVGRFGRTPRKLTFKMEERKVAQTRLGSVLDITSRDVQQPDGTYRAATTRAQVVKLTPAYNGIGRQWGVTCVSYLPDVSDTGGGGDTRDVTKVVSGVYYYINIAALINASPTLKYNITLILDGATIGSREGQPSIQAGNLRAGSTIKIICINETKWSAKGGDGASIINNQAYINTRPSFLIQNPTNGSTAYESNGISTDVYLNYGNVLGYETSSTLFASGAGGAGSAAYASDIAERSQSGDSWSIQVYSLSIASGGGGSGIPIGLGGMVTDNSFDSSDYEKSINEAGNGSFEFGGDSQDSASTISRSINAGGTTITATANTSSSPTNGGFGEDSTLPASYADGNSITETLNSESALAGFSLTGGGVTVYNLSAHSDKFTYGRSIAGSDFTLITS